MSGAHSWEVDALADLDGDPCGFFLYVPHLSAFSALSFLLFLDLLSDLMLLHTPDALGHFFFFLVLLLGTLTSREVFLDLLP